MCVQPRQRSRSSGLVVLLHDLGGHGLCAVTALGLFKAVVLQSPSLSLSLSLHIVLEWLVGLCHVLSHTYWGNN